MLVTRPVLVVDLGKSRCRAVVIASDAAGEVTRRAVHDGVGAPGLAAEGGVAAALEAILPAAAALRGSIGSVAVGAAGAWAAPTAASELATALSAALDAPAVVTSDVVSAHAGALGGGAGVLLIAGTGAVALGIRARAAEDESSTAHDSNADHDSDSRMDAEAVLVDGWGPELGDLGSGSWLGREALRSVLRASVGLAPATVLTDALAETVGEPARIQAWISEGGPLPRRLASLAPVVLDAAEADDAVAAMIAADAVRLLVASAVAASSSGDEVAVHGGLAGHDWFRTTLGTALRRVGRVAIAPAGDALDGAWMLARRTDLLHERFVHRAG